VNVQASQKGTNLKDSVTNGVQGVFASILGSNPKEHFAAKPPTQTPVKPPSTKPRSESATTLAAAPPDLPRRPPVASVPFDYGLLPEEEPGLIQQTQFTDDHTPIAP
jgi:hypothetical protein